MMRMTSVAHKSDFMNDEQRKKKLEFSSKTLAASSSSHPWRDNHNSSLSTNDTHYRVRHRKCYHCLGNRRKLCSVSFRSHRVLGRRDYRRNGVYQATSVLQHQQQQLVRMSCARQQQQQQQQRQRPRVIAHKGKLRLHLDDIDQDEDNANGNDKTTADLSHRCLLRYANVDRLVHSIRFGNVRKRHHHQENNGHNDNAPTATRNYSNANDTDDSKWPQISSDIDQGNVTSVERTLSLSSQVPGKLRNNRFLYIFISSCSQVTCCLSYQVVLVNTK